VIPYCIYSQLWVACVGFAETLQASSSAVHLSDAGSSIVNLGQGLLLHMFTIPVVWPGFFMYLRKDYKTAEVSLLAFSGTL
jgi:hypothetical protein